MKGCYKILLDNELIVYDDYDSIPKKFDNLIYYAPDYPEGPHTEEEHEMIARFEEKLKDLLRREHASSN